MRKIYCYGLAATLFLFCACGDDDTDTTLTQTSAVSECGGFSEAPPQIPAWDPADYCSAEMLYWAYDASSQTLSLANTRILLNCCGDRSIKVTLEEGVYVITERDAPEPGGNRCRCMCVFDFFLDVSGIAEGVVPVRLRRDVTDDVEASQVVWQGDLDLAAGSGEATVDASDMSVWCRDELEE